MAPGPRVFNGCIVNVTRSPGDQNLHSHMRIGELKVLTTASTVTSLPRSNIAKNDGCPPRSTTEAALRHRPFSSTIWLPPFRIWFGNSPPPTNCTGLIGSQVPGVGILRRGD